MYMYYTVITTVWNYNIAAITVYTNMNYISSIHSLILVLVHYAISIATLWKFNHI